MTNAPLARVFRITDDFRRNTVRAMLERHHTEAASYWTQLVLATGIATFGLVLDSVAVIIGAMLVAPLMGPIVELAMGLAVGSALLALRSAMRVALSVCVAVLFAGLTTRLLPFQEVTAEIAGRTSPTVLDLMVACFCALTAAYVTLRPHDSMGTAAGTSIGISLVPPLCASGFGLGVGLPHVAWGALLLFTANLSAILLFAVIVFLLAGFGRVKAGELELEVVSELERKGAVVRVSTWLNRLFGSRQATVYKLVLPVTLVGAVFLPLQRALSTVSAEVRARQQVAVILGERAELRDALLTTIGFDRGGLSVRIVVVGDPAEASELESHLREEVARRVRSDAVVSVIGVPDGAAFARLTAAARPVSLPAPAPPPPPPPVAPLAELRSRVAAALAAHYPEREAGPLVDWAVSGDEDLPTLRLTHLGEPLGPAASKLLGDALVAPLHGPVRVVDDAFSPAPRAVADGAALAVEVAVLRSRLSMYSNLRLCVQVPAVGPATPPALRKQVETTRAAVGAPDIDIREGPAWTVLVSREPCSPPASPPPSPPSLRAP